MLNTKIGKKSITIVMAVAIIATMFATAVSAYSTSGHLTASVHLVPILKDSAEAYTTTNFSYNGTDLSDLWTKTIVYAYNGDEYAKNQGEFTGGWCIEGFDQSVTAKIRSMDKARGYHYGGGEAGSASTTTVWNK